jgi:hypothetical protein
MEEELSELKNSLQECECMIATLRETTIPLEQYK